MNNNLKNILGGEDSLLTIKAQKELIDHRMRSGRNNALLIFFIIFPTVFLFIGGMIYFLFKFLGLIH